MEITLEAALCAQKESASIEFKTTMDTKSTHDWCEIVKDVVAIANSGGGIIIFGLDSYGIPSGDDVEQILDYDPANLTDKVFKYTGYQLSGISIAECEKQGYPLAAFLIEAAPLPVVFQSPGQYEEMISNKARPRTVFHAGTTYFRHGAKSEPCNTDDLRQAFDRALDSVRKSWLENIRQVVEAPLGSIVTIHPSGQVLNLPVRLTDDPSAPTVSRISPDETHPFRQTELIHEVLKHLPAGVKFNNHDVVCIRKLHDIKSIPRFYYTPKFGSPQYSSAFVEWIRSQYEADNTFFEKLRQECYLRKNSKND